MRNILKTPAFYSAVLMTAVLALCCSAAWVSDDAFITVRTVRNFLDGYGLRYNIAERVQTYTNPLLMLSLSAVAFFTKEFYFTLLALNLTATAGALYVFYFKQEKSIAATVFCSVFFILSAAFKDYATSGLENSFSCLLYALFFLKFFKSSAYSSKDILHLTLITSLILLNRMDAVLIVLPALAYACYMNRSKRLLWILPLGFLPFALWELFCLIYYGFPFPNTAYAKLNTGIALKEYLERGINYYKYTLISDPVTLIGIGAGLITCFVKSSPPPPRICAGIGIVLYLLYILYIGGDFMGGRFFASPLFVSIFTFPYGTFVPKIKTSFFAGLVLLTVVADCVKITNNPFLCVQSGHDEAFYARCRFFEKLYISDERKWWKEEILKVYKNRISVKTENSSRNFLFSRTAGILALFQPEIHIVDIFALTDVLISRLPSVYEKNWWNGHILRPAPKGYKESVLTGENKIIAPEVAGYYDKLKEVTTGNIFSWKRFKYILDLNMHPFKPTEAVFYLKNASDHLIFDRLSDCLKKYDIFYIFNGFSITVDIERLSFQPFFRLDTQIYAVDFPFHYTVTFINTLKNLKESVTEPHAESVTIRVPEHIRQNGFDRIEIKGSYNDNFSPDQSALNILILKNMELSP